MVLPLEGIKVIELGAWVVGPTCARALGELGADVIKVSSNGRSGHSHAPYRIRCRRCKNDFIESHERKNFNVCTTKATKETLKQFF